MVVFTCSACGESLEKAHVEKHVLKCGSGQVLSCIDCSKDFCGDDYKNHSKCVSEDQKCGGKDVQVKENKGDVKQRQWIQRIQEAMERPDVDPNVKKILQKVSAYDNVPRKRAKFENWMKNCLKVYAPFFLEKVWEICSAAADRNGNQTKRQTASEKNENKTDERKNKQHKRKTSDENSEEQNGENANEKQTRKKMKQEEKEQNEENTDKRSGDDYKNHSKCVSEDQKCGGKDVQVKENKGDVKQRQWIQRIQRAVEQPDVEPSVLQVLQMVIAHKNVPRKKAKFENWMKNCTKIYTPILMEKVWEICSAAANRNGKRRTASERKNRSDTNENKRDEQKNKKHKRETSDENSEEQNGENTENQTRKKMKNEEKEQNEENADENSNKKQKKGKQEATDESLNPEGEELEKQESESDSTGKRDAPEDGLAVKKLRKKLLSLFNRKINSNPKFKILKDGVRLGK